jgi:hypothetical protein
VSNVLIYNNYFYGSWVGSNGNHVTAPIFIESNSSPTSTQNCSVFNNLVVESDINSYWMMWLSGDQIGIYNNTLVSPAGGGCLYLPSATNVSLKNNLCSSPDIYGATWFQTVGLSSGGLNNNLWFGSGLVWKWANGYYSTLPAWQAVSGGDSNATASNPNLNSNYIPMPGSAAIKAGVNLSALGLTALNVDRSGLQRPQAGSWDIGAYQATSPLAPTGLAATAH